MINLARFDLNLLSTFEAVLLERNVTRAAGRLGVSQPTVSHALQRLRGQFGDHLFYRDKGQMVPTPFALELAQHLGPAFQGIRSAMQLEKGFDPKTSTRRFLLGMSDSGSYMFLRRFSRQLERDAPNVAFDIVNMGSQDAVRRIAADEAELAFGDFEIDHPDVNSVLLFTRPCVVLADPNNTRLQGRPLDLERFVALPHVVWMANPAAQTRLDATLAMMGLRRRVAVAVPHFLAVPNAILGTDRLAVFYRFSQAMKIDLLNLVHHEIPPELNIVDARMQAIWDRKRDADPGLKWLVKLMASGDHDWHPAGSDE